MGSTKMKNKADLIKANQQHEKDTGSSEVQITLLTERITQLTEHLKTNKKDHSTRRGLLMLVNRRRKLTTYLNRRDPESLQALAKKLKLKLKD